MDDREEIQEKSKLPISRIWSVILSTSIFGLYWMTSLKKVQIWLCMFVPMVLTGTFSHVESVAGVMVLVFSFVFVGLLMFMTFKWTTEYNLKHFGYKTKGECLNRINN